MPVIHPSTISVQPPEMVPGSPRRDGQHFPSFTPGEVLMAEVADDLGSGRFLITLKGATLFADSAVPLRTGARIMVKVDQLQPRMILSLMSPEASDRSIITDYLKEHRANPDAMANLAQGLSDLLESRERHELSRYLTPQGIMKIRTVLDALIATKRTLDDPLFVENFIARLGLLWESELRQALQASPRDSGRNPGMVTDGSDNLKALLMNLSDVLHGLKGTGPVTDSPGGRAVQDLATLVDASVKTIETQQVHNVVSQENSHRYLLQIPFLVPGGMRTGDIFIGSEQEQAGKEGHGVRYAVAVFLSLDALGDIMIEAAIGGGNIGCVITCENNDVRDFIMPSLEELGEKLASIGYTIDRLSCMTSAKISERRNEYRQEQDIYGRDVIDFFA